MDKYDQLRELGKLREQPFSSDTPVIGGLIARFRTAWNGVSTKWYVRPILTQQSTFNELVANALEEVETAARLNKAIIEEQDDRLLAQDQDHVRLTHDLGELTARLTQLGRTLDELEARLGMPEERAA